MMKENQSFEKLEVGFQIPCFFFFYSNRFFSFSQDLKTYLQLGNSRKKITIVVSQLPEEKIMPSLVTFMFSLLFFPKEWNPLQCYYSEMEECIHHHREGFECVRQYTYKYTKDYSVI